MLQLTINNIVLPTQSKTKKGGRLAKYAKENKIQDPAGPWNLVAICNAPKVFETFNFSRDLIFGQTFVYIYTDMYMYVNIFTEMYIYVIAVHIFSLFFVEMIF